MKIKYENAAKIFKANDRPYPTLQKKCLARKFCGRGKLVKLMRIPKQAAVFDWE